MDKYKILNIDKYTGFITVEMIDDDGNASDMTLAGRLAGQEFSLNDAKKVDVELLELRDQWISQNSAKAVKTIHSDLQQYSQSDVVKEE